jgi:hypothetical protein
MPLPQAVEEANRRAEELMARQQQGTPDQPAPEQQAQPQVQPQQQAEAAEPAPIIPAIEGGPEPAQWEQKYRVLQGKYRAEVVRVQDDNRTLRSRVQELEAENGELKSKPQAQATAPQIKDDLRKKYAEKYGDEFATDIAELMAQSAPAPQVDLKAVEQRLAAQEEVVAQTAKQTFFGSLTERAPQWKTLNTDDGFLTWLRDEDPLTGVSRQTLFDSAAKSLDVDRVARFFTTYSGQSVGAASQRDTRDEHVVPSTASNNPAPVPPGKAWNRQMVAQFYADVRTGRITQEQAAVIEQDIYAAQREGRLR